MLSFETSRQIDLLCDEFESAWHQGKPRPIEDYLRSADATLVPALRAELLQLELECRFQRGQQPRTEDYATRFPECAGALQSWVEAAATAASQYPTIAPTSTVDHAPAAETTPAVETPGRPLPPVLGEYELLERLGTGGMGEVYRARHRRLGKFVALKVMREKRLDSAEAVARFHRETEAVGQLDHPHLVEAHDAGEQDGVVYLVLKLIDGVDFHRLVKEQGPLPVAEACELVRQAALGLQYLHECGLVHRDLKPSNLMRTPTGVVKVLDLGLARLRSTANTDDLTSPNAVMGTPDYLAPEQADNPAAVDIRADLYSLGATLFYLLTGKPPFAHRSEMLAKLKAHGVETPADVRSLRPEVPADVAALVARLLAKRPEQRFATPQELADALAPFTTPTPASVRPRPGRSKLLLIAAGVLLVPLAVWAMLALLNRGPRQDLRPIDSTAGLVVPPLPVEPSAPAAGQPLKVLRLDVDHYARVGNFSKPLGLLGKPNKSFATRCDDQLSVTGELSAKAYCYLIAYRPDGTEELCFPEKENEVPPLTDRPRYPVTDPEMRIELNEGPGLCAFVLVARSKPLPPYAEWRKERGESPWTRSDALAGVVWRHDGTTLKAYTPEDPEARGKGHEVRGAGELPRLVEWLRQETEAEAVSAVAFAVRPRE
jgi:serine/threonine protein kinase